jgi:hypothetical protein
LLRLFVAGQPQGVLVSSPAVALWTLLETGVKVPKGTGHIVADGELCTMLARRLDVQEYIVREAFEGLPVKEVRAVSEWILERPAEERIRAMRSWRRRRDEREAAKSAKRGAA